MPSPAVFIKIIFRRMSVTPTVEEKLLQGTVGIKRFLPVQDRNVTPTSPIFVICMCLSNVSVRRDFAHDVFELLPATLRGELHWSAPSFNGSFPQFLTPWIQRKYSTSSGLKEVDCFLLRLAIPVRNLEAQIVSGTDNPTKAIKTRTCDYFCDLKAPRTLRCSLM